MKICFAADEKQVKDNLIIEENNKFYNMNFSSICCGILSNNIGSVINLVADTFHNLKQDMPNKIDIITADIDDKDAIEAIMSALNGGSFRHKVKVIEITSILKQ